MSADYTQDFIDEVKGCRTPTVSGEGGIDVEVREALDKHTADEDMHYSDQKVIDATSDIFSNDNLLINPNLKINQRGKTEYTDADYSVDRWRKNGGGTVTVTDNGVALIGTGVLVRQAIENFSIYYGKTLTVSCEYDGVVKSGTFVMPENGSFSAYRDDDLSINIYQDPAAQDWLVFAPKDTENSHVLSWAKLELGSVATPFVAPDPAEELLKIQSMNDDGTSRLVSDSTLPVIMNSQMVSNPNLLDNPDLSIDQRGKESWSPAGEQQVYTVDRWYAAKCTAIKLASGGISLAWNGTDGDSGWIQQKIPTTELFGKVVTISADLDGERHSVTSTVPTTVDKTVGGAADEDGSILFAVSNHGNNLMSVVVFSKVTTPITIENIKIELGSVATPFIPPEPATELAKCQRYYQICTTGDIDPIDLRPSMRITPTVTALDDGNYAYSAEL